MHPSFSVVSRISGQFTLQQFSALDEKKCSLL
jgi:hypothetical protein